MDEPTEILSEKETEKIFKNLTTNFPVVKPNTVPLSQLKGDLDNIVLMALRKESERRYSSVEDLSNDISNYLNGLPVSARPNTFFYRTSKFYQRNKTASIIGALLILSLILGIIATSWQAVLARKERDLAQQRFNQVRQLSNSLLFEITPKIERLEGSTEAREIVVNRALEYLDKLSNEATDDLQLKSELASAYEKVGDVQGSQGSPNLGDLQGGIASYQKAQKIRLELAEKNPDDFETQKLLAANFNASGDFKWWASNVEGAMEDFEKAIGIFENLENQNPEDLQTNVDLLNSIINRIKVISYNGNYVESVNQYREVEQKIEKLEQKYPQNIELKRMEGLNLIRIAYDLSWQDRYDILDEYVKRSSAVSEPLIATNPNDSRIRRDVYFIYFQAGGIYAETNPTIAHQYLEKSAAIAKVTLENDKLNSQAKYDLAQSYSKLGEVAQYEKKYANAIDYLNKAGATLTELTDSEPKHDGYRYTLANNYARIAAVQGGKGDYREAIENFQKAIDKHEELRKLDDANVMPIRAIAIAEQDLAAIFEQMKRNEDALKSFQKSVEMFTILEKRNSLSEYDKKFFDKSRKSVESLQK